MRSMFTKVGGVAIATLAITTGIQNQALAVLTGGATSVQDSFTGLEWLRLDQTDGLDISLPALGPFLGQGYTVANGIQVQGLLGSFFGQFGLPNDPLAPPGDPAASISDTLFSAWTGLFGETVSFSPFASGSGGRFISGPSTVSSFGVINSPLNVSALISSAFGMTLPAFSGPIGSFAAFLPSSGLSSDLTGVFMVRAISTTPAAIAPSVTSVPTPALLPGLIGFGVSVLKRKKKQTAEA